MGPCDLSYPTQWTVTPSAGREPTVTTARRHHRREPGDQARLAKTGPAALDRSTVVRYLSAEWLEAVTEAGASEVVRQAAANLQLTVQQVVTDGPDGDLRYVIRVADGRLVATAGDVSRPDVTITADHGTAVAVATGRLSLPTAFMTGRVKVKGDPSAVVQGSAALAAVASALGHLRATTTYE